MPGVLQTLHNYLGNVLLISLFVYQIAVALPREKTVDIFQLQALGFREEQVDDWHPQTVQHGKNNVSAPSDVADRTGCDLYNDLAKISSSVVLYKKGTNLRSCKSSWLPSR